MKEMKDKEDGPEKVSLESQEFCGCHPEDCDKDVFPSLLADEKSEAVPQGEKSVGHKNGGERKPEVPGQWLHGRHIFQSFATGYKKLCLSERLYSPFFPFFHLLSS